MTKAVDIVVRLAWFLLLGLMLGGCRMGNLWWTPDQQGQRLMQQAKYSEAAAAFTDPFHKGVAYYRAGQFEAAGQAFSQVDTAAAHFNRGNALVMLGQYQAALNAYDQALQVKPEWPAAVGNREIARLRAERLEAEGGEGTDGMLAADDIVVSEGAQKSAPKSQTAEMNDRQSLSDKELQALWLRRVQTQPADFLRAKFAYQHSRKASPPVAGKENTAP